MKISEAATLIRCPTIDSTRPQTWIDLGCGSGTFTLALAQMLAPNSTIQAIDHDPVALERIAGEHKGVVIHKTVADLRSPDLRLPLADGALMANALHFIPDQLTLLRRVLKVAGSLIFVEYERATPNPWGPYPVPFERLREMLQDAGAPLIQRLATRRSRFGGAMYSAFVQHFR